MAARFDTRMISVAFDSSASPQAISAVLAAAARAGVAELIRSGQASDQYVRFVDGVEGVSEDRVKPDGTIAYRFSYMGEVVEYVLKEAKARSPVDSGEYRDAWLVVVNGRKWTGKNEDIPANAVVMIVNPVPYARKVDTGGMRMSVPPGIIEAMRQATQRVYRRVEVEASYVVLPSGIDSRAPYTLKRQGIDSGLTHRPGHGYVSKYAPKLSRRKDRAAGQAMTYPALIMRART